MDKEKRRFSRRRFLAVSTCALAASSLSTFLPKRTEAYPSYGRIQRARLSNSQGVLTSKKWDVVIVGSGYGGSVLAAHLAGHSSVAVLERGQEWHPGNFPESLPAVVQQVRSSQNPLGLFDFYSNDEIDVLVGCGLGGTSLINSSVLFEPDAELFNKVAWPNEIKMAYQDGSLTLHMQAVKRFLNAERIKQANRAPKKQIHHQLITEQLQKEDPSLSYSEVDLAINFSESARKNAYGVFQHHCIQCGNCATGCNVGAKKTLDANYLPVAKKKGAYFFTQVEVDTIEKDPEGLWRIHTLLHPSGRGAPIRKMVLAQTVFLAAGTLGSTRILLRSEERRSLAFSELLGHHFSANGDFLGIGYNTRYKTTLQGTASRGDIEKEHRSGPTITSVARYGKLPKLEDRILIQDGVIPFAFVSLARTGLPLLALDKSLWDDKIYQDLLGGGEEGALNHSIVYLGIGHDSADGVLALNLDGDITVRWPMGPRNAVYQKIIQEMKKHTQSAEGIFVKNPSGALGLGLDEKHMTVHPLGGVGMGNSVHEGVVNHKGQVFDRNGKSSQAVHAGLYVMDGSVLPTSVGVNPMLLIAALARRTAELFLKDFS